MPAPRDVDMPAPLPDRKEWNPGEVSRYPRPSEDQALPAAELRPEEYPPDLPYPAPPPYEP